jgi:hypothetical protein
MQPVPGENEPFRASITPYGAYLFWVTGNAVGPPRVLSQGNP